MKPILFFCTLVLFVPAVRAEENPFVAAGVPDIDRVWDGADYKKASEALLSGKVALPRLTDPDGKKVLDRFTNEENLDTLWNSEIAVASRLKSLVEIMNATDGVLKSYYATFGEGDGSAHAEMALLMGLNLRIAAEGVDLADEFVSSIPEDDQYEEKAKNMENLKDSLSQMFMIPLGALSAKMFSKEDKNVLLTSMEDSLPFLVPQFTEEDRQKVYARLIELGEEYTGEDLQLIDFMLKTMDETQ